MAAPAENKLADLKRDIGDAGQVNPVADRATQAATTAAGTAQEYAAQLADAIRQQPLVSLAIGMTVAYLAGRIVTLLGRSRKRA